MSTRKHRLTVTVDKELFQAGLQAIELGEADSVSSWVSAALKDRVQRDRKLRFLAAAIANFEEEFGEITTDEIASRGRLDRESATVVRGQRPVAIKPSSA